MVVLSELQKPKKKEEDEDRIYSTVLFLCYGNTFTRWLREQINTPPTG